jgi:PD-(D/E)XK nuclease superfamily protein
VEPDDLNPAQRRLVEELLEVRGARPALEPGLAERLRDELEVGIAPVAAALARGARLTLNKTVLAALVCDGRYLDHLEADFAWSAQLLRGKLVHRAVELDWRSERRHAAAEVVERAWADVTVAEDIAAVLAGLDRLDADVLRQEVTQLLLDLRDLWPAIPAAWTPRFEQPAAASFADGAVTVRGRADLVIGRPHQRERRRIVIDFTTGWRNPQRERQDLRLYALLLTLRDGVEPWRLATYYVAEGAWDVEDVTPDGLEAAVHHVLDAVARAARLLRDPEGDLRLTAGPWCRWCGRVDSCPAAAARALEGALA